MTYVLVPSELQIQKTLRSFLLGLLPAGMEVVRGQDNRVPEPRGADFAVLWGLRRRRIETSADEGVDVLFMGSITGATMTIASVMRGVIVVGQAVFGVGVAVGTVVTGLGTGTGGAGTYIVAPSQTVAIEKFSAGMEKVTQATEVTYQIDVHGPSSANNAEMISTLFRDSYGVGNFVRLGASIYPLYADEPRQMPFLNAEQQFETRWVVEACMQVNQTVSNIPQEFMDEAEVTPIDTVTAYQS